MLPPELDQDTIGRYRWPWPLPFYYALIVVAMIDKIRESHKTKKATTSYKAVMWFAITRVIAYASPPRDSDAAIATFQVCLTIGLHSLIEAFSPYLEEWVTHTLKLHPVTSKKAHKIAKTVMRVIHVVGIAGIILDIWEDREEAMAQTNLARIVRILAAISLMGMTVTIAILILYTLWRASSTPRSQQLAWDAVFGGTLILGLTLNSMYRLLFALQGPRGWVINILLICYLVIIPDFFLMYAIFTYDEHKGEDSHE